MWGIKRRPSSLILPNPNFPHRRRAANKRRHTSEACTSSIVCMRARESKVTVTWSKSKVVQRGGTFAAFAVFVALCACCKFTAIVPTAN